MQTKPSNTSARLFRTVVTIMYWASLYYYHEYVYPPAGSKDLDERRTMMGRCKYLTYLNMLLQCGYFGYAMINDLFGTDEIIPSKQSSLQRSRDWVFTSIALPIGVCVSVLFWGLYAIDRELIFPSSMDTWFPSWLNHIMHTLPVVAVMMEVSLTYHKYQTSATKYLPIATCYILYVSLLCYIAYFGGFWVYPVFAALDLLPRTVFLAFLVIPTVMFYTLGEKVHYFVWESTMEVALKTGKQFSKRH